MASIVDTAKEANMILLQYLEYLEVWKLGKTSQQSGNIKVNSVAQFIIAW